MRRIYLTTVAMAISAATVSAQPFTQQDITNDHIKVTCWTLAALAMTSSTASADVAAFKAAAQAIRTRWENEDCWNNYFSRVNPVFFSSGIEVLPEITTPGDYTVHIRVPERFNRQQLQQIFDNAIQNAVDVPQR